MFHLYLAPDGPPVNITITMVTPYSVSLQWDPPTPDKQNGLIVSYTINVMTYDQVVKMVVLSNTTQQTISNLTPYTSYMFKLAASTTIEQGPPSLSVTATTSETCKNTSPHKSFCSYFANDHRENKAYTLVSVETLSNHRGCYNHGHNCY